MASSTTVLTDMTSKESMDRTLSRIYAEGFYPGYSAEDSVNKETTFSRTVMNNVSTNLLEFKKYDVYAPYYRHMVVFLFDSLMYQLANHKLDYKVQFVDENTNVIVDLSVSDAVTLLNYCMYRKFGIDPVKLKATFLPSIYVVDSAYRMVQPLGLEIPTHFHYNGYNYQISSVIKSDEMIKAIPWSNGRKFTSAETFVQFLGTQFEVMVQHIREVNTEMHLTHQWCMWWFYKFLLARETVKLREDGIAYFTWIEATEGVAQLLAAYDALGSNGAAYDKLCETLIGKILPIEYSSNLEKYSQAIYDNTKLYDQLKSMFIEWTSHDLTYLDTDRTPITFLNNLPISIMTAKAECNLETEITDIGSGVTVTAHDQAPYNLGDEFSQGPTLSNEVPHEESPRNLCTDQLVIQDIKTTGGLETEFYEKFNLVRMTSDVVDSGVNGLEILACVNRQANDVTLVDATIPSE